MTDSILIKNVHIVLDSDTRPGDVLVKNGKIAAIDASISDHAELEIDGKGLTLMPGVIDPHVHFREPGADWKENLYTGSKAAVSGGVTSFFEMPNTKPSAITIDTIQDKKDRASKTSLANYNFFIGATKDNLAELNGVENVAGIKIFVGSSTGNLLVDGVESLGHIFANGRRLIAVHSEDEETINRNKENPNLPNTVFAHNMIRNVEAAVTCTKKLLDLAKQHSRRLHICHLTTAEETDIIQAFRQAMPNDKKFLVTTEVSPQHLFLHLPDIYDNLDTFAQINPPLREKRHGQRLWQGLLDGTISMIGTDHAPHTIEEKKQPFGKAPSGMPGVETSLPIMLTQVHKGACTLQQLKQWMATSVARDYGIQNKGDLKVGYDADLVLVDTRKQHTLSNDKVVSKCGWTAFEGMTCVGAPIATIVNGHVVFREGDFFEEVKGKEIRLSQ